MDILSTLGSIFSGGLTGLIGVGIKAYTSYKTKKLEFEHEEKMQELTIKSMQLEKEIAIQEAKTHLEEEKVKVSGDVLKTSYIDSQSETSLLKELVTIDYKSRYGNIIGSLFEFLSLMLALLRTSVRPITTYYFEVFLTYIFVKVWILTKGIESIPQDKLFDLLNMLIYNLLFCGTTIILWWFGSRAVDNIFNRKR